MAQTVCSLSNMTVNKILPQPVPGICELMTQGRAYIFDREKDIVLIFGEGFKNEDLGSLWKAL